MRFKTVFIKSVKDYQREEFEAEVKEDKKGTVIVSRKPLIAMSTDADVVWGELETYDTFEVYYEETGQYEYRIATPIDEYVLGYPAFALIRLPEIGLIYFMHILFIGMKFSVAQNTGLNMSVERHCSALAKNSYDGRIMFVDAEERATYTGDIIISFKLKKSAIKKYKTELIAIDNTHRTNEGLPLVNFDDVFPLNS